MKKEIATIGLVILIVASISSLLVNTKLIDATVICVDKRDNTKVLTCSDPNAIVKNSLTRTNEILARESNITTSNGPYTLPANSQIQNQTQIHTQTDCKEQGRQLMDRYKIWWIISSPSSSFADLIKEMVLYAKSTLSCRSKRIETSPLLSSRKSIWRYLLSLVFEIPAVKIRLFIELD